MKVEQLKLKMVKNTKNKHTKMMAFKK